MTIVTFLQKSTRQHFLSYCELSTIRKSNSPEYASNTKFFDDVSSDKFPAKQLKVKKTPFDEQLQLAEDYVKELVELGNCPLKWHTVRKTLIKDPSATVLLFIFVMTNFFVRWLLVHWFATSKYQISNAFWSWPSIILIFAAIAL